MGQSLRAVRLSGHHHGAAGRRREGRDGRGMLGTAMVRLSTPPSGPFTMSSGSLDVFDPVQAHEGGWTACTPDEAVRGRKQFCGLAVWTVQ